MKETAMIVGAFLLLVAFCRIFAEDWIVAAGAALIVCLGVFLICVICGLVEYEKSPDLVTLKKDAWRCEQSHRQTTFVMAGKILVPVTDDICDVYGRIGRSAFANPSN